MTWAVYHLQIVCQKIWWENYEESAASGAAKQLLLPSADVTCDASIQLIVIH